MTNDMNDHLKRLRFLTSNYELLQGYPIAMAGLLFILEGFCVMIWGHTAVYLIYSWLFLPSLALLAIATKMPSATIARSLASQRLPWNRAGCVRSFSSPSSMLC